VAASPRAFVLRHTRLRPVPGLEEVRLHLADAVLPLWHAVQIETADPDAPLPFWAFAWAGGLAIGRYLREHPEAVAGRRVFDLASGSGLCAIAAMHADASEVAGADIDRFAAASMELNARANGCRVAVAVARRDVLDEDAPDVDVILAGDCWYDGQLAERVLPWLQRARARGIDVLVGDPGRRYLPTEELIELASFDVRTTTELEDLDPKQGQVNAVGPSGESSGEHDAVSAPIVNSPLVPTAVVPEIEATPPQARRFEAASRVGHEVPVAVEFDSRAPSQSGRRNG
jgi:predicted nicotinamide N-methyase